MQTEWRKSGQDVREGGGMPNTALVKGEGECPNKTTAGRVPWKAEWTKIGEVSRLARWNRAWRQLDGCFDAR